MSDRPNVLLPKIIYDDSVTRHPEHLDEKTVELITIGVATALKCDHCLNMHLRVAQRKGISDDEVFEAILLGSALSSSAVMAQAMRVYENHKKEIKAKEEIEGDCIDCIAYENHNLNNTNHGNSKK
jgi:AhpD family alkylhydroperoxidase